MQGVSVFKGLEEIVVHLLRNHGSVPVHLTNDSQLAPSAGRHT